MCDSSSGRIRDAKGEQSGFLYVVRVGSGGGPLPLAWRSPLGSESGVGQTELGNRGGCRAFCVRRPPSDTHGGSLCSQPPDVARGSQGPRRKAQGTQTHSRNPGRGERRGPSLLRSRSLQGPGGLCGHPTSVRVLSMQQTYRVSFHILYS